jgi:hypothetical protein
LFWAGGGSGTPVHGAIDNLPHPRKPPSGALAPLLPGLTATTPAFPAKTQFHLIDPIYVHRSFLLTYLIEGAWTNAVHVERFFGFFGC